MWASNRVRATQPTIIPTPAHEVSADNDLGVLRPIETSWVSPFPGVAVPFQRC